LEKSAEYELKLKIDDPEDVRKKLSYLGASFQGAIIEIDHYYQHPCRDFSETDEALRVRDLGGIIELTYKGPREKAEIKAREEVTARVVKEDLEKLKLILEKLGFTPLARVVKQREVYLYDPYLITIDNVEDLGTFMEIELRTRRVSREEAENMIRDFLETLGIMGEKVEKTYLEMILEKR